MSLGMRRTFVNIIKRHGWTNLWGGLGPTLLRDVPFSAVYWGGYEISKVHMIHHIADDDEISPGQRVAVDLIAGALAGTLASIISNPFDVIKTQRQMSLSSSGPGTSSVLAICRRIVREDGWRGFTRGMLPRTAKVAPGCAIMISTYEFCKQLLQDSPH